MHPAGILHFASPDFIAVLVIMRKNYKKDSSESVLPGHVRFGQAKKKSQIFLSSLCKVHKTPISLSRLSQKS